MRRVVLQLGLPAVAVGLLATAVAWGATREPPGVRRPDRPHVVLITMDTVRADHLGCYGYPRPTSPHLDRFAERAIRYETSIASAPWTLPSHASMFTGQYPHRHGARTCEVERRRNNVRRLPDGRETLAETFRALGYRTAAFVANDVYLGRRWNLDQGFDRYRVERRRAHEMNDDVLEWLERQGDRPFFLFINYMDAHRPYNTDSGPEQVSWKVPRDRRLLDRLIRQAMPEEGEPDPELRRKAIAQYDNGIAHVDRAVGELIAALGAAGLHDETLLVITSDHGEYFGAHDLVEHSKDVYEGAVRVPLLIGEPGRRTGRVDRTPITSAHLPRMILERVPAAREACRRYPRGEGEGPMLTENYYTRTKDLFHPRWGDRFDRIRVAVYGMPFKLIHSTEGEPELYHLGRDPRERRDLADRRPGVVAELRHRVPRVLRRDDGEASVPDDAPPTLSEQEIRNLRALGYVE